MRRLLHRLPGLVALVVVFFAPSVADGQEDAASPPVEDRFTVFLVTAGPGDAVWERFGHNGIWIHDEDTGEDLFWEWGLFSFSQTGFIPRLAKGTMLYAMAGRPLALMMTTYRMSGRPMWAQELALDPEQEAALNRFVRNNALPENRDYVYHYYLDNCSTRVRDALDHVLGGQIRATFEAVPTEHSWRWQTRRLLRDAPLAEAGVQLVLGTPGDAIPSVYQEMFLPQSLQTHLRTMTIVGADGVEKPLVVREAQLLESLRPPDPSEPANRLPIYLLLGLLIGGGLVLLGRWASRGSAWGLRTLGAALVGWCGLVGLLGLIVALAWAFTDHDFWRWNENLLLANPLLLAAVPFALPMLLGRKPGTRLASILGGLAALAVLTTLLQVLPGIDQQNGEMVALLLPAHLALAWGVRHIREERREP